MEEAVQIHAVRNAEKIALAATVVVVLALVVILNAILVQLLVKMTVNQSALQVV